MSASIQTPARNVECVACFFAHSRGTEATGLEGCVKLLASCHCRCSVVACPITNLPVHHRLEKKRASSVALPQLRYPHTALHTLNLGKRLRLRPKAKLSAPSTTKIDPRGASKQGLCPKFPQPGKTDGSPSDVVHMTDLKAEHLDEMGVRLGYKYLTGGSLMEINCICSYHRSSA